MKKGKKLILNSREVEFRYHKVRQILEILKDFPLDACYEIDDFDGIKEEIHWYEEETDVQYQSRIEFEKRQREARAVELKSKEEKEKDLYLILKKKYEKSD